MPIIDIIRAIYEVGKTISQTAKSVTANKVRCQRLAERVQLVLQSVKTLESIKDSEEYTDSLNSLKKCLDECLDFISEFKKDRNWFVEVLKSSKIEKKFQDLCDNLVKANQQLSLGINVQQLVNREQDIKDIERDNDYIIEQTTLIVELNKMALQKLQNLDMKLDENKAIWVKQGESIKDEIKALRSSRSSVKSVPTSTHTAIDAKLEIGYHEILFGNKIAVGSFGNIYLGRWSGQVVAVKAVEEKLGEAEMKEFVREVTIMSRLHHGNVVTFYGACVKPTRLCLVMEYMERGSLDKILASIKLNATQQRQMILDIAYGLRYLHAQGVLHRDLKSGNILIDASGKGKITDFGLSKTKALSVKSIDKKTKSIEWQAPESFKRGNVYDAKADIYSFGMILWEIVTGQKPYASYKGNLTDYVFSGHREDIPTRVPKFYQKLIQACWDQNPQKRPALDEIIQQIETYQPNEETKQTVQQKTGEEEYNKGLSFEKNKQYDEAYMEYKKSANLGYGKAFTNIGFFHLTGKAVVQSQDSARQFFLEGAKKGHTRAMVNLGIMYEKGIGVTKDNTQALDWYKKASDMGDKDGMGKYEVLRKGFQESGLAASSSSAITSQTAKVTNNFS